MRSGLVTLLCLGLPFICGADSPNALLAKAVSNQSGVALCSLQRIRVLRGDTTVEYLMLVEQDGTGRSRFEVVSPIRHRGLVFIEDAKCQTRFDPINGICEIQPSLRAVAKPIADRRRLALVRDNYRVVDRGTVFVGDRAATLLHATAARDGTLRRVFWVDREHRLVLRMQVYEKNHVVLYEREMLFPRFGATASPEAFQARFDCGVIRRRQPAPKLFTSLSALSRHVGFDILIPPRLPNGLSLLYTESMETEAGKTAVLRFSDGLAHASVYQVRSSVVVPYRNSLAGPDRAMVFSRHGSKYTIVGDLGEASMKRLAAAFEEADKERQLRWAAELARQMNVSSAEVYRLLDSGLDLNDAAFLLGVRAESREELGRLREWWSTGLTRQEILDRSKADRERVFQRIRMVGFQE